MFLFCVICRSLSDHGQLCGWEENEYAKNDILQDILYLPSLFSFLFWKGKKGKGIMDIALIP